MSILEAVYLSCRRASEIELYFHITEHAQAQLSLKRLTNVDNVDIRSAGCPTLYRLRLNFLASHNDRARFYYFLVEIVDFFFFSALGGNFSSLVLGDMHDACSLLDPLEKKIEFWMRSHWLEALIFL